jgi:hypothetical protein
MRAYWWRIVALCGTACTTACIYSSFTVHIAHAPDKQHTAFGAPPNGFCNRHCKFVSAAPCETHFQRPQVLDFFASFFCALHRVFARCGERLREFSLQIILCIIKKSLRKLAHDRRLRGSRDLNFSIFKSKRIWSSSVPHRLKMPWQARCISSLDIARVHCTLSAAFLCMLQSN